MTWRAVLTASTLSLCLLAALLSVAVGGAALAVGPAAQYPHTLLTAPSAVILVVFGVSVTVSSGVGLARLAAGWSRSCSVQPAEVVGVEAL